MSSHRLFGIGSMRHVNKRKLLYGPAAKAMEITNNKAGHSHYAHI